MAKNYIVLRHDEKSIVLGVFGALGRRIAPGTGETIIARSSIAAVTRKMSGIHFTTVAGERYVVMLGSRQEQKALVLAAFGLSG